MSIKQILQQAEVLFQKAFSCSYTEKAYKKLEEFSKQLTKYGVSANIITFAGVFFAVLGLNFLAIGGYFFAFLCLVLNRLCDVLDGINARQHQITPFGAFLDICSDYTSAGLFILGFILANPDNNATSGAFLLVTLLIASAALLGSALVAGQSYRELNSSNSKICMWGAVQNADIFAALFLMCVFPMFFMQLALFFGLFLIGKSLIVISNAYYNFEIAVKGKK